jgi:hypothetical protein
MAGINLDVSGLKVLLEPVSAQTFSLTVPSAVPAVVEVLATGPQGPGVPRGGVEFDLLEKAGPDDFDTRFTSTPSVRGMSFSTTDAAELDAPGDLAWDDLDQALAYRTNGIMVDIAQENLIYVRNPAGETPITRGMAVSFEGASANRINVRPCVANLVGVGCATAGVALTDIPSPGFGFVSTFGLVRGFDTTQILTDGGPPVTEGQELFISTTPGVVATFPAVSPARRVTVGYVVTTGQNGAIFVTVRRGLTVNELDNVIAPSPSNGQALVFDVSAGVWQPGAIDAVTSVNGETGDVVLDAADVGAYADDNPSGFVDASGAAAAAPVQSVNSLSGTVVLDAAAVGAYPSTNPDNFIDAAGAPVQSVNGASGTVVLAATDVGAYPDSNPSGFVDAAGAAAAAPVQSVNGASGTVVLDATDVGAYPDSNPSNFIDAGGAPVQSVNGLAGTVVLDAAAVGAYADSNPSGFVDAAGAAAAAPVQTVNGASGTVVLDSDDVGAIGTATGLFVFDYGTAIPDARPDGLAVYWQGTAEPGTAISRAGDIWFDTTGQ